MVRTQIQLTENQAEVLKYLAAKNSKSMAEIIRQSIDTVIQSEIIFTYDEQVKKALNSLGKFHSGINDFASKHDKYLAEAYK